MPTDAVSMKCTGYTVGEWAAVPASVRVISYARIRRMAKPTASNTSGPKGSTADKAWSADVDPRALVLRRYPDPVLRAAGVDVPKVDALVRAAAERMIELMREHKGIGLAAQQAGLAWNMFVVDVPMDRAEEDEPEETDVPIASDGPVVFINPRLELLKSPLEPYEEGCLSLPGVRGDVLRPTRVRVSALDAQGKAFSLECGGLLARCVQHEFDHTRGVLILDKLTAPARTKNRRAIKALEG
jgi:peptide deformylase